MWLLCEFSKCIVKVFCVVRISGYGCFDEEIVDSWENNGLGDIVCVFGVFCDVYYLFIYFWCIEFFYKSSLYIFYKLNDCKYNKICICKFCELLVEWLC